MKYEMKLKDSPFNSIKAGRKTIELRLNDEKRQLLKTNDLIEFTNIKTGEKMLVQIKSIFKYSNFEELYKQFDKISLGYNEEDIACYSDMDNYYSKDEQQKYGVLAIEISLVNSLYSVYLNLLCSQNIPDFLQEYLSVPSLIRLKKIGYFCGMDHASKNIYDFKEKISRYDHSLNVALLTWKYTRDKKTTLAGLFHDIATPCFSHVIDYMNKDYENQESTEAYTEVVINNDSKLLELLTKDKIFVEDIINFKNYSIVDNKRPKLCADRLDGIILPAIAWTKTIDKDDIISIVSDLEVYENEFGEAELGFITHSIAQMVLNNSEIIDKYCHSSEDNYMMELLAKITKIAIDEGLFTYEDLYYYDEFVIMNKIKSSNIKEIKNLLTEFENKKPEDIPTTIIMNIKKRHLNPLVNGTRLNQLQTNL